ncbi:hypothetical protein C2L80_09375 [Rubneribacter badeniensis]|uniref:DUF4190 domain-containing protein n=1 Tax=Rubneribacter badeniensis TaxID=2070688 RepID=A0A2K2U3J9_9ACTN|nr:FxLYD domain-containing protein [Rubneribacter badeniensis]PNV64906.1 hypothetical protein C2L80_09375 [Rubneribacter badeniensis]
MQQNQNPAGWEAPVASRPDEGRPVSAMAVTSLVLGIVALLVSVVPIVNSFSILAGLLGVIFGIVGIAASSKGAKKGRGMAVVGLAVCAVSVLVSLASCGAFVNAVDESTNVVTTEDGSSVEADSETDAGQDAAPDAGKYEIADEQMVDKGFGMYAVTGTLTNTSGKDFGYLQVNYVLKDASGTQVGTAWANTNNLSDGVSWKFEALASVSGDEAPASFELADVTGF